MKSRNEPTGRWLTRRGVPVPHHKDAGGGRQRHFRELDGEVFRQIVSGVAVAEEVGIEPHNEGVFGTRDLPDERFNRYSAPARLRCTSRYEKYRGARRKIAQLIAAAAARTAILTIFGSVECRCQPAAQNPSQTQAGGNKTRRYPLLTNFK